MEIKAVKTVEQQALLSLHRARHRFVKARTAKANLFTGKDDALPILRFAAITKV